MKRPRQHIIETKSRKAFENLLPDEWVARPLSDDYGIDYMVEIFKENKSTGKHFYAQLKGTDKVIIGDMVKISLPISSLEYYQTLPIPILFVIYSIRKQMFWGIWINEFLKTKKIKKDQKTFQLNFDKYHIINEQFIEDLTKNFSSTIHKKISITYSSDHLIGNSYHDILIEWIKRFYPDLFVFNEGHYSLRLNFIYSYKKKRLSIKIEYSLLGKFLIKDIEIDQCSDFLNYPNFDYYHVPHEIKELLFLLAILLANENILASLKLFKILLCDYSGTYNNPVTLLNLGKVALDKHCIAELQELINKTIMFEKYNEFQFLNAAYLLFPSTSNDLIKNHYKENLLKVISLIEDDSHKGMLSYNLANSYRGSGELRKAVKYYMKAKRLEPDYLNRYYWWNELAGVLFLAKHYKWAELSYLKAHKLSTTLEPLIFGLIADSLFFQGKFTDAIQWFDRYFKDIKKPSSEFCLKSWACNYFIDNKLENPKRDPRLAISIAEQAIKEKNDKNAINKLEQAISIDPLCGLAWFYLGFYMKHNEKAALNCYLICCLLQDWDRESWPNALFLSFNQMLFPFIDLRKFSLFHHIVDIIKFKFEKTIIYKDIANFIKKQTHLTNEAKKKFYKSIQEIFELINNDEFDPDKV